MAYYLRNQTGDESNIEREIEEEQRKLMEHNWRVHIRKNVLDGFEEIVKAVKYVYKIYLFVLFPTPIPHRHLLL